jgi:hypothetical protein
MREAFDRPQVLAVTTVLRESSMSALGRIEPFAKPSANDRSLREGDGRSRREAVIAGRGDLVRQPERSCTYSRVASVGLERVDDMCEERVGYRLAGLSCL